MNLAQLSSQNTTNISEPNENSNSESMENSPKTIIYECPNYTLLKDKNDCAYVKFKMFLGSNPSQSIESSDTNFENLENKRLVHPNKVPFLDSPDGEVFQVWDEYFSDPSKGRRDEKAERQDLQASDIKEKLVEFRKFSHSKTTKKYFDKAIYKFEELEPEDGESGNQYDLSTPSIIRDSEETSMQSPKSQDLEEFIEDEDTFESSGKKKKHGKKKRIGMDRNFERVVSNGFGSYITKGKLDKVILKIIQKLKGEQGRSIHLNDVFIALPDENILQLLKTHVKNEIHGKHKKNGGRQYKIITLEDVKNTFHPSPNDDTITNDLKQILLQVLIHFFDSEDNIYLEWVRSSKCENEGKQFLQDKKDFIKGKFMNPVMALRQRFGN
jgi:hypothetical protein